MIADSAWIVIIGGKNMKNCETCGEHIRRVRIRQAIYDTHIAEFGIHGAMTKIGPPGTIKNVCKCKAGLVPAEWYEPSE
jgi:hypothetical protein